jgi:hypothetical protein
MGQGRPIDENQPREEGVTWAVSAAFTSSAEALDLPVSSEAPTEAPAPMAVCYAGGRKEERGGGCRQRRGSP